MLQGYNVNPESDAPVAGIEREGQQAILYIDEDATVTEITLNYNETQALQAQLRKIIREMEWEVAKWVYASDRPFTQKTHLMHKGEHNKQGKSLCGQTLKQFEFYNDREWDLEPVVGEIADHTGWCCKRCLAIYQKETAKQADKLL